MKTTNKRFAACLLLVALMLPLAGCAPRKYTYKVFFENGDYEYYELNYKPLKDCRAIEYDGETIIGVERVERVE